MCVIAAKYLDDYGWVGIKARDRNYMTTIDIKQDSREGVEALYIFDSVTAYSEGINEYGVCIINAATSVKNDESEAAVARRYRKAKEKQNGTFRAPDGIKIRHALRYETPKEAAEYLASVHFQGNTLCFNQKECYILECTHKKEDVEYHKNMSELDPEHEWKDLDYEYTIQKIDKKDYIVRTNHGNFLTWAGYQKDSDDENQIKSRKSSEARHDVTIKNLKNVTTPDEMLDALCDLSNDDPQLNPIRLGDYQSRKKLKTTGILLMIPSKHLLKYIPVWCKVSVDKNFTKINSDKTKTFFELGHFRKPEGIEEQVIMCFEDFKFNYLNKEEME
jgi:hypothetical protein